MALPFKMQKTRVIFSLTLILKVRIPDIPKLSRNAKRYIKKIYQKTFEEHGNIRKIKIYM